MTPRPHTPPNDEAATTARQIIGSLTLPWPDKRLSPNARVHWRTRAAATRRARRVTRKLALAAGWGNQWQSALRESLRFPLLIAFYPPDRRRRDDDNLVAAFKAYRDELAQVLGLDDQHFIASPRLCEPSKTVKGGCVEVSLRLPSCRALVES